MTLVSANVGKIYADICGGSLERGARQTMRWSKTAIFSAFARYIFITFRDYANIIMATSAGDSVGLSSFKFLWLA